MALNNKIVLFLRHIYKRIGTVLAPVSWTLSPELTAQEESEILGYLERFAEFAVREDVIGAAHYLNQIIEFGCSLHVEILDRFSIRLHIGSDARNLQKLSQDLLDIDVHRLSDVARWAAMSMLISCAQTFFRHGQLRESCAFIDAWLHKFGPNHMLSDIALAQSWSNGASKEIASLVETMASGGLGHLEYFKGRYCRKPFDEFEIRSDGEIFVCCPSFLPYSIDNIYQAPSTKEILNSKRHVKIRDSITRQDFRYCRWLHCTDLKNGLPTLLGSSKLHYAPSTFRLSYDPTCNLWCPSCRKEKIVATGAERDRLLRLTEEMVLPLLKDGEDCMMNGYGDVFASKACRRILEEANRQDFPKLSFTLISNGVLFTEREWQKFPSIHDMVRSIRISIDAACKDTYDKVRLGGDWDVLQENLLFLSGLRKSGVIREFMISFVAQDSNFEEMPDFASMGKKLGCDFVVFEPLMNWNTFSGAEFINKAVHYKSNPLHEKYMRKRAEILSVIPRRTRETLKWHGKAGYETLASGSLLAGLD